MIIGLGLVWHPVSAAVARAQASSPIASGNLRLPGRGLCVRPGENISTSSSLVRSPQWSRAVARCLQSSQPVFGLRHGNQVNVIGHQAVAPYRHAEFCAPRAHRRQTRRIIVIVEEGLLSAVAAPGNVMRQTRNHQPCQPSHDRNSRNTTGVCH